MWHVEKFPSSRCVTVGRRSSCGAVAAVAGDSTQQRRARAEDPSDVPDAVRHRRGAAYAAAVRHRRQRALHSQLLHLLQQDGDRHHDTGRRRPAVLFHF